MKKIFCDICEVELEAPCRIIEETTVSNNQLYGVQMIVTDGNFDGPVNNATDKDLCRSCVWKLVDRINPYGTAFDAAA